MQRLIHLAGIYIVCGNIVRGLIPLTDVILAVLHFTIYAA